MKIINLMRQSKRSNLIGRAIAGANALYTFFDIVYSERFIDPIDVARTISEDFGLLEGQKRKLDEVARRTAKAKEIASKLDYEYKPGEKGNLEGRARFFREVFKEEAPEKFGVRNFTFAFGIYLPGSCWKNGESGLGGNVNVSKSIDKILDYNIGAVRRGTRTKDVDNLCFRVNIDDPVFGVEYTERPGETSAEKHELKHIIDKLVSGLGHQYTDELSADLFSGIVSRQSLFVQAETQVEPQIRRQEAKYKRYLEQHFPEDLKEDLANSIKEKKFLAAKMKNRYITHLIADLEANGMDPRVLSYVVTTTPIGKLERRLDSLRSFFRRKMRAVARANSFSIGIGKETK